MKSCDHIFILMAYSLWEHWLGKTKKLIANSTIQLIVDLILRRKIIMAPELVDVKSDKGEVEVKFAAGKLVASAKYGAGPVSAEASVSVSASALGDALKKAIPGTIDDAVIDLIVGALEKIQ